VRLAEDGALTLKPANVTFEEAACVGVAGLTAVQALRDHGNVRSGDRVLVNGASGGVGTFAVQIAKALGADVTAVCSTANVDLQRSIGADHVVDYTREDFTRSAQRYDPRSRTPSGTWARATRAARSSSRFRRSRAARWPAGACKAAR